jgi:hypothetical protein
MIPGGLSIETFTADAGEIDDSTNGNGGFVSSM